MPYPYGNMLDQKDRWEKVLNIQNSFNGNNFLQLLVIKLR